jgi:signal transduction histidine kinase/CheY-like chemotaxis protein
MTEKTFTMDNPSSVDLITALTADYLNVYVVEPEADLGTIVKLDGYVINGIKEMPKVFSYSKVLQTYADDRVCDDDREAFLKMVLPKALVENFADGKDKLELQYRVPIDGKLEHYSGLYTRISKPGEPLKIVAGFRSIENIISVQKKTRKDGLYSAYAAVSDLYLAMFRVNLKENIYTSIKTTDAILKHTIPDNNKYDENLKAIMTELADEKSLTPALDFLDRDKIEKRMQDKSHISLPFKGKVAGSCRLHLIKEDENADGSPKHLILAVEVLEEGEYQPVFDVLARGFQNVFLLNTEDGSAKILKLDGYITAGLNKEENRLFHYPTILKEYIEERVYPEDREMLYEKINMEHLLEVFSQQQEYIGNYRVLVQGEVHNFQYNFSKPQIGNYLVCGFQNIDAIIEEHLEKERIEKEKEKAHQEEIAKSYRKLDEMHDIIRASRMGTWSIYLLDGKMPSMEADDLMREILGIEEKDLTPEETYNAWFSNIAPSAVQSVLDSVEKMKREGRDENTYLWIHPTLGERYVRCGGTAKQLRGGFVLRGYHYDVDRTVREQKQKDIELAARQKKERELEEARLREEREHAEMIDALSTIYSTIFRADLDTHQYEILTSIPLMKEVAEDAGIFDVVKEKIVTSFIEAEMHTLMHEFLDLNTLADRMKESNTVSAEYKAPNGQWIQARFIAKRRDENGVLKEVLYVARDITEEKKRDLEQQENLSNALAAAQQANKAKSTFLNSMSHDIRTPMNAIIGFTALAQTHIENQNQVQDYLAKISTSSTHLLSLINDILDMSRIESGTVKLDEKAVHIPDLLHDLRTIIQGLVNAKNLNLFIDTQDVMHEDVITDKVRLNQVLINIVGNAIKFTKPGGDIIIRLVEKPCRIKHYTTYEFSVKDNGIGMSQEFLGHIFDTFSREYSSTVSGIQGAGLGMSITKNIVDMMGGEIEVESEEGKGSLFTVTLNLRLANEPAKNEPIPELMGARALVVDDDLNICRSVSKMLRDIKMRPDWTASGREAIVRAQDAADMKDEYKVYIIDYLMPDMNGIETVRRIRRVISEDVPIIVLTAYDWADFEYEAREAGVTAFVSKPIFMSELREVLTQPAISGSIAEEEKKKKNYDYSGKRVLLVEDNELNREIATAILEETGMTIDSVNDGDVAVSTINGAPDDKYDLILMDVQMPKMDGYTATREIRTLPDNKKANIPIVAMTANAFEEDKRKAYESGMNGHIIKPISIEEIGKVLDEIFAEKE